MLLLIEGPAFAWLGGGCVTRSPVAGCRAGPRTLLLLQQRIACTISLRLSWCLLVNACLQVLMVAPTAFVFNDQAAQVRGPGGSSHTMAAAIECPTWPAALPSTRLLQHAGACARQSGVPCPTALQRRRHVALYGIRAEHVAPHSCPCAAAHQQPSPLCPTVPHRATRS